MNFIEAVTELKGGRCEGIKRENWRIDKVLILSPHFGGELRFEAVAFINIANDILADDWQLVNPRPLTEEVEVVRWECIHCHHIVQDAGDCDPPDGNYCCQHHVGHIKLTGTYTRTIPVKTKRREYVGEAENVLEAECDEAMRGNYGMSADAKIYAEWQS